MPRKYFDVIVCDPPYNFSDKLEMSSVARGAEANYKTMSNPELLKLPIQDIANPNGAILALWVPSSLIEFGIELMNIWGFETKQTYIWTKRKKEPFEDLKSLLSTIVNAPSKLTDKYLKLKLSKVQYELELNNSLSFGMGRLFRQSHEICLIGINNNGIYKKLQNKSQRSVCFAINEGHSIKPNDLHQSLELMFPKAKYIELFARRERDKWLCVGNEINGNDIRNELDGLIKE